MSWRDELRPASFRGVAFRYERFSGTSGRATVRHDLPQRDLPYLEDLGGRGQEFRVDGYLIGDDYPAQLARLKAACDKRGTGTLIHPTIGEVTVVCTSGLSHEIAQSEGRAVRVSMTFVESTPALFPVALVAPRGASSRAASALEASAAAAFVEALAVEGVPESVRAAAAAEVAKLGKAMQALELLKSGKKEAADLLARATKLVNQANSLVTDPSSAADEITGAIGRLRQAASNSRGALEGLRSLMGLRASKHGGSSTNAQLADANAIATQQLIVRASTARAVEAAATVDWTTKDEAIAQRDAIASQVDELSEADEIPDQVYQSLRELRAVLNSVVPPLGQQLPSLAHYTPSATQPSLVIAYRLYDDAARSVEIAERNSLRLPGFTRGGVELEVLADA